MDCYSLNGQKSFIDGKTHAPCNTTAVDLGGHSICCPIGDLCLTNGMCKKKGSEEDNWYMRRACTDPEWKDPACPSYCAPIEPERNTSLIFKCFTNMAWCCAYVGENGFKDWPSTSSINTTCCNNNDLNFTAEEPIAYAIAQAPDSPSKVTTLKVPSIITITAFITASATEIDPADLPIEDKIASSQEASPSIVSTSAKVGLGVGIPVGLLALTAIGAFIWMRRKKQSTGGNNLPELDVPTENVDKAIHQHSTAMYRHELPSQDVAAELPAHAGPYELPEQTIPAQ